MFKSLHSVLLCYGSPNKLIKREKKRASLGKAADIPFPPRSSCHHHPHPTKVISTWPCESDLQEVFWGTNISLDLLGGPYLNFLYIILELIINSLPVSWQFFCNNPYSKEEAFDQLSVGKEVTGVDMSRLTFLNQHIAWPLKYILLWLNTRYSSVCIIKNFQL